MSHAPTPPRQTCGAAGDEAPAIRTALDAAVRPDLFVDRPAAELSRPVQLKAAVVAGEANGERGSGAAAGLPTELRAQMERSLGADFSGVRVREDASAAALGADAYARGEEITFAPGRFDPASTAGKELIGHELVHVVQQRQGRVAATQARGGTAINADAALEREADELGARAARGEIVELGSAAGSASTDAAQLRPGKVKAKTGVRVHVEGGDVVVLPRGTKVDIEGTTVKVLSGLLDGTIGTVDVEDLHAFEYLREPTVGTDHVVYPGCSTSFVGLPRAVGIDGDTLVVQAIVQTRNIFDRVRYKVAFQHPDTPEGPGADATTGVRDKDIVDQNPPWSTGGEPIGDPHYTFASGFEGFPGRGTPSALRTITVRIPIQRVRAYFQERLGRWTDTGICIELGLDMFYGGSGPAVATERERAQAYEGYDPRGHQYGFGATSSPQSLGRVTFPGEILEKLGIGLGDCQERREYHQQELGDNPPNSLEQPFPQDYPEHHSAILPLVPARFLELDHENRARLGHDEGSTEMQLKLQTRIENEATLRVSTGAGLEGIVELLSAWGEGIGDVTELMSDGELLGGFTWKLESKKPMVFTDVYLDDEALHALRAGIGIRKRRSKEAAKLNVKTGAGYNVKTPSHEPKPGEAYPEDREGGEGTDIWRRHEIGFSLDPDATPEEIGAFLESGKEGDDPWNLGAQQVNSELDEDQKVVFSELREQMVLVGFRQKFNLCATPRSGKGVINIEISCDHTVGCRRSDWDIDPNDEGFDFHTWYAERDERTFPETFNVEMELEHLGAGGSTESTSGSSTSTGDSRGSMWALPSQIKKQNQDLRSSRLGAPIGYPERRPYTKKDSESSKYGTPSFSVFYAAHNRVIDLLRENVELPEGDLGPDVQKLEALRDKLGLGRRREKEEDLPRDGGSDRHPPRDEDKGPRRGSTDAPPRSSTPEPTTDTKRSTETPRDRSTTEHDGDLPPPSMSLWAFKKTYTKGTSDGTGLNCLLDSLYQVAPDETEGKFGGTTRRETVEKMRQALVEAGFTKFRRMLDIASAEEGQAILAVLDIDVVVFIEKSGEIQSLPLGRSGGTPRYLHFKDAHYSPVFKK